MDGKTLIEWGYEPGPWFDEALELAKGMVWEGASLDEVKALVARMAPHKAAAKDPRDWRIAKAAIKRRKSK